MMQDQIKPIGDDLNLAKAVELTMYGVTPILLRIPILYLLTSTLLHDIFSVLFSNDRSRKSVRMLDDEMSINSPWDPS
jgi:hypothetical protein